NANFEFASEEMSRAPSPFKPKPNTCDSQEFEIRSSQFEIHLGMRRLSIIDVDGGHQPIYNEDGTVAVILNGEIYNFQSLRLELAQLGHQFRTRSDSEVIVHAYEEWGTECVQRLEGMFAFAVYDRGISNCELRIANLSEPPAVAGGHSSLSCGTL